MRTRAMPLVWACIAPHGGELIPELCNGNAERMRVTREAMEELGRRCRAALPDTIVVYTPHGHEVPGHACISVTKTVHGILEGEDNRRVSADFAVDARFAFDLCERASARSVPTAQAAYLSDETIAPMLPMDWGALVPLWFMGHNYEPRPQVVVVCPSRELSRRQLVAFGQATAESASLTNRRIALICSADQGHGHSADGPYGFAPMSPSYDRAYCQTVRENALHRLLHWREDWIEAALSDSYWQTLMLYGVMTQIPMNAEMLSYEAPTYFGMLCAELRPR